MNVSNVTAIEEVKFDLENGERFYELQKHGLGVYFRDCIITNIELLCGNLSVNNSL